MILYLHGFRSSPQSYKARLMQAQMDALGRSVEFFCPELSPSPALAIAQAEEILRRADPAQTTIIGSSLGGYYATWLAEQVGCQAVLLNPATKPPQDLERYIGVTTYYHSERVFEFKAEYVDELRSFAIEKISAPTRYFLIAATGDEVLDYRDMLAHYPGATQIVLQGSDHGLAEFADYMPQVLAFCDRVRSAAHHA